MRKEFEPYYRDDVAKQEAAGRRVHFFTTPGYKHLTKLIGIIKQGGEAAAQAEKEFTEITYPWAERSVAHNSAEKLTPLDVMKILHAAIEKIKTKPEIKDWKKFHSYFGLLTIRDKITHHTKIGESSIGTSLADTDFAAHHPLAVTQDPSAPLQQEELQAAVQGAIDALPAQSRDITHLRGRLGEEWTLRIPESTGINRDAVKSDQHRIPRKILEQGKAFTPLRDWFTEQRIDDESIRKFPSENFPLIEEQKQILRRLFPMAEGMFLKKFAVKLAIPPYALGCLLGDSNEFAESGALSNHTKETLIAYLQAPPDYTPEKLELFEATFEKLRELTHAKPKNRVGSAGPSR